MFSLDGTDWSEEFKITIHPKPEVSPVEPVNDKKKSEPIPLSSGMTLQLFSAQNIEYAKSGIKIKFTLLTRDRADYLVDRYSERMEAGQTGDAHQLAEAAMSHESIQATE
jgi:hypothetical protein